MPADPSVDLAALDALYQAATPTVQAAREALGELRSRDGEYVEHLCAVPLDPYSLDAAAYIEATLPLMDMLPSLRRELEIGRAAVEVIDTVEALCEAWDANGFSAKCLVKDSPAWRLYQARARLRALRETKDA